MQKFKHDCDKCRFLGHFFDQDVYICDSNMSTIIARASSDGPDYSSMPLMILLPQLNDPEYRIQDCVDNKSYNMREWFFSGKCPDYYRAWLIALAIEGLKATS